MDSVVKIYRELFRKKVLHDLCKERLLKMYHVKPNFWEPVEVDKLFVSGSFYVKSTVYLLHSVFTCPVNFSQIFSIIISFTLKNKGLYMTGNEKVSLHTSQQKLFKSGPHSTYHKVTCLSKQKCKSFTLLFYIGSHIFFSNLSHSGFFIYILCFFPLQ